MIDVRNVLHTHDNGGWLTSALLVSVFYYDFYMHKHNKHFPQDVFFFLTVVIQLRLVC